jgi:hypothetical protein
MFIPGVNDTGEKMFSGVNDTGEKFIAGVVDTGNKFIVDTGDQLSVVTTIPAINDTADKHPFANISGNFQKKFEMNPMSYSEARGTLIYEKNLKSKSRVRLPLKK